MQSTWVLLFCALAWSVAESARLDGYGYKPPRPQGIYETPTRPTQRPVRPPQQSYQTPRRPQTPRPRPPQQSYQTPRPRPPPTRPPQPSYQPPRRPPPPPPTPRPRPPQNTYQPPRPKPSPPKTSYKPQKLVPSPSQQTYTQNQEPGMPYDFEWGVQDTNSGNSYSHVETSDGKKTQGEYKVLLPDGRTQVVKFYDDGWGFVADVTYE